LATNGGAPADCGRGPVVTPIPLMKLITIVGLFTAVTVGCAASPATTSDPSEVSPEAVDGASSEEEKPAPPKSKSEQCEVLGNAIESGIAGGTRIVSLNEGERLKTLATEWKATVERVGAVDSELPELVALRDELVSLGTGMAEALTTAGGTGSDAERKGALARYHELNGKVDALVDEFNAACG
jgi:hypothetical protein